MRISTALTVLSLSSVALAVPAIERRSSRAECLADALAKVFPTASAEFYYVTICFIGRSTIDLKDKSMNRWQPWYKHLSTVTCDGEKADCYAIGHKNDWIGSALPGPDNIAWKENVPGKCTYSYVVWHEMSCTE